MHNTFTLCWKDIHWRDTYIHTVLEGHNTLAQYIHKQTSMRSIITSIPHLQLSVYRSFLSFPLLATQFACFRRSVLRELCVCVFVCIHVSLCLYVTACASASATLLGYQEQTDEINMAEVVLKALTAFNFDLRHLFARHKSFLNNLQHECTQVTAS